MKCASPSRQSSSRCLVRNDPTIMRARLCMKPVARSSRMPASTSGTPVRPSCQRRNARSSCRQRTRSGRIGSRATRGYAASSWAKKSRHASSRVQTRTPSRSAGSRDSRGACPPHGLGAGEGPPAQMRREPRRRVETRADRGSRDSAGRRRAGTRRVGRGQRPHPRAAARCPAGASGTVTPDAGERAAPAPSRAASSPPAGRRRLPGAGVRAVDLVRAPAPVVERSRRLHERRLGGAHASHRRARAPGPRAPRARGPPARGCARGSRPAAPERRRETRQLRGGIALDHQQSRAAGRAVRRRAPAGRRT